VRAVRRWRFSRDAIPFCWRGAPSGISERIRPVQRRAFSSELPHQRCYLWAADIGRASHPRPRAGKWRCRRPPSLEYIPSLGATTRTCSFPCFGCTGRRLRPWLRRVAPVRMSARTTLGPDAPAGHHGRDSAMRAKRALDSGPAAETVMTETLSTKSKSGASDRIGTERG